MLRVNRRQYLKQKNFEQRTCLYSDTLTRQHKPQVHERF
jgi:hypothetical protein